jgi:hypothetical protein
MLDLLSISPPHLAPRLPDLRQISSLLAGFAAHSAGFDTRSAAMAALKSFAMLVGQGEGAPPENKQRTVNMHSPAPEPRYAYYRRCQQFRRNGEQCRAPAMKGEHICHRHAEQADMERRRAEQRREILSRPGAGLGSFRAIQRTIGELTGAILAGSIDHKTAGRLIVDIQMAIRLQKMLTTDANTPTSQHRACWGPRARRRGGVQLKQNHFHNCCNLNTGAESPGKRRKNAFAGSNGRSSACNQAEASIGGGDAPPTMNQAA